MERADLMVRLEIAAMMGTLVCLVFLVQLFK
jgi:hypothetical protein